MTATEEYTYRPDLAEDPRNWLGYRRHSRAKSTGTLVVLVDAYEQGLENPGSDPDGNLKWALICDAHDGCVMFPNQAEARPFMAAPEEWCPGCQRSTR